MAESAPWRESPDYLAAMALNRAISANSRAADYFANELTVLADAAGLMGQSRLGTTLARLAQEIVAQAGDVSRCYGGALHAECDANVRAIADTINTALGVRS